jgi:MoxR-like ATPase
MLNTIAKTKSQKDATAYVKSYMKLIGTPKELVENFASKSNSPEWKNIVKAVKENTNGNKINKRLIIKFGKAGTGKTTQAIQEVIASGYTPVIISATATQDDESLFVAYDPETKKYVFTPIAVQAINGEPIIIDEINHYNIACMEKLQAITDGKDYIQDEKTGLIIQIKDGFKIIGTMNLTTNLGERPLPTPLVDRCESIEDYDEMDIPRIYW